MRSVWKSSSSRALGVLVTASLVVGGALAASPALADETAAGAITGHVLDAGGQPVENVLATAVAVDVPDAGEGASWGISTDAAGAYSITDLPVGTYKLEFDASWTSADVVGEWWDDARTEAEASVIVVGDATVIQADAELAGAGSIAGVVSDAEGAPVAGVDVTARRFDAEQEGWVWAAVATTDAQGAYVLPRLPDDTYQVSFGVGADVDIVPEYWQDATDPWDATSIELGLGEDLTGISPQVEVGGGIAGAVTDEGGAALANIGVTAYVENGLGTPFPSTVWTDEEGRFHLRGLRAGDYRVEFAADGADANVAGEWWDDAPSEGLATLIEVSVGATTSGVDAELGAAGTITGSVVDVDGDPFADVGVELYSAGGGYAGRTSTLEDGSFSLPHLRPGDYTLRFDGQTAEGYSLTEWWNNAGDQGAAAVISVGAGQTVDAVDVKLAESDGSHLETYTAALSGTVTDAAGAPIEGASISITEVDHQWGDGLSTNAEGRWLYDRIPAGRYIVAFSASIGGEQVTRYWADGSGIDGATVIDLARGEIRDDISITLRGSAPPPVKSSIPTVAGDPRVGETLSVTTGSWTDDTAFAFQWFSNGTPLAGANQESLTLTAAQLGKTISVAVTGAKEGFSPVTVPSAATAAVRAGVLAPVKPTISGTAAVGSTLTVTTPAWQPAATLSIQWLANGTAIAGATGTKLLLASAERDKTISVRVKGVLSGYTTATIDSISTLKVATVATPTISGTPATGSTVTANPGTWTTGSNLAFQWFADGVALSGAIKSTYVPTAAEDGKTLTVRVTATKAGYGTAAKTSKSTLKVLRVSTPKITGTVAYGSTLKVDRGVWSSSTTYKQQWYADGKAVAGATATTLKLTSGLKGKRISVKVTGSKPGYATVGKTSASTGRVATAATPSITGTRAVGATLSAKRGTWTTGTSFSYRWYADGNPIAGATSWNYRLTSGTDGKRISISVTGRKSGYATVTKSSSTTSRIMRVGTPSISGKAFVTGKLTASRGTWSSGVTFRYQWYASGRAISGATGSSLTLASAQLGKSISVKVIGSRSGYATGAKTSSSTPAVRPGSASPVSKDNCPSSYPIKGNQTTRHTTDWIYHMPGQQYYDVTDPEQCFATEKAAQNAGYRKSLR